mgnify:CR=1 FL=1
MAKRGNGEGSIYYSEKLKRWVGQFCAGYKLDGKLNRKTVYGKTRAEVKDKINKALVEIKENNYIEKSDIKLVDIIQNIIDTRHKANKNTDRTYIRNLETIKLIKNSNLANMNIQKIVPSQINEMLLSYTNYSNSTINKIYSFIHAAFTKATSLKLISFNPFNGKDIITKPKSNKQTKSIEALTIDEQKMFIEELKKGYDDYTDIFYIAIYTGMRVGEILALSPKDINLKENLIHINKTLTRDINDKCIIGETTKTSNGKRDIPITALILPIVKKYTDSSCKLVFNNDGKIINPITINAHFKKICKNAGIRTYTTKKKKHKEDETFINLKTSNVNTHMLRHTYATRCIEAGMSAVVLSKLLGHSKIEITLDTYTSVFNKFKEDEIQKYTDYITTLH